MADDDIRERVARLEANFQNLKDDIDKMGSKLDYIKEKVSKLDMIEQSEAKQKAFRRNVIIGIVSAVIIALTSIIVKVI